MERIFKNEKGITLVALVVTIVILIILATISVTAVIGENGIIQKAQTAKGVYANSTKAEEAGLSSLEHQLDNITFGYNDNTLPIRPKVAEGMTKVKYNSTNQTWERVTDVSEEWYDYGNKQWANVVLGDATFDANGILNESAPYTQLVWIPRYAYKITSMYHQNGDSTTAGNIEVVFIDIANKSKEGTTYSTTYPSATTGINGSMSDFVVHPAFEYGGQHLAGIWVGKFESSHTGCTATKSTGEASYNENQVMTVKAGVTSWRNLTIGNAFNTCLNMNREGNPYGLNTNDEVVDPHLTKNDEWGACAYLSQSRYGKNAEVFINNNSNYITGIAGDTAGASESIDTTNSYKTNEGIQASTTGNVSGIYDMSGGNWERTAAYVNNGTGNLTTNGGDLVAAGTASRYRNVYAKGSSDTRELNYEESSSTKGYYGDAIWETSSAYDDANCWYSDISKFPYVSSPFFLRGGRLQ